MLPRIRRAPLVAAALLGVLGACARRAEAPAPPAHPSCFLLYEVGVGEVMRSPRDACATRLSPDSTFKIPHALVALDSGVLAGTDVVFPYDGNEDASSGLTTFWLDGSLRISPDEQERFLLDLYADRLALSHEAMRAVRSILEQPSGVVVDARGEHAFDAPWPSGTVVGAKTGRGEDLQWLVGHVQRHGREWIFVSCVTGPTEDPNAAIRLAADSLQSAGVL
jgi:beta-lactamase class D